MVASFSTSGTSPFDDHPRQALGQRSLAHPGLADVQRVVLAPAAQDLDGALDLELAPDQRVDLALRRQLVEVGGVLSPAGLAVRLLLALHRLDALALSPSRLLGTAILDRPCEMKFTTSRRAHILQAQQVDRMRLLLAENGHQHVGRRDFLLDRWTGRGTRRAAAPAGNPASAARPARRRRRSRGCGLIDELAQFAPQPRQVGAAGLEDFDHLPAHRAAPAAGAPRS